MYIYIYLIFHPVYTSNFSHPTYMSNFSHPMYFSISNTFLVSVLVGNIFNFTHPVCTCIFWHPISMSYFSNPMYFAISCHIMAHGSWMRIQFVDDPHSYMNEARRSIYHVSFTNFFAPYIYVLFLKPYVFCNFQHLSHWYPCE